MYTLFAQAIRNRSIREDASRQPTFATAVDLHRFVHPIKQVSDTNHEATFE